MSVARKCTALPADTSAAARRARDRDARAHRPLRLRHIAQRSDTYGQPLPTARLGFDLLDPAAHVGAVDLPLEHRRAHPLDADLGESKAESRRQRMSASTSDGSAGRAK
jgi:hypothetical protein